MQKTKFNRICIIGLGYIGLPTAVAFANAGKQVIGVDINEQVVASLKQGKIHIIEPDLQTAFTQAVKNGYFFATQTPEEADAFIIAVPTPLLEKKPDLSYMQNAALAITPYLRKGNLVVLESTSPVGTTEKLAEWLSQARPDLAFPADVHIAYCPERVLPGRIMTELVENNRIIGGLTPNAANKRSIYTKFLQKGIVFQPKLARLKCVSWWKIAFVM